MIFCHKNEKEITLGADSAQENWGSHAKVSDHSFLDVCCLSFYESAVLTVRISIGNGVFNCVIRLIIGECKLNNIPVGN